MTASSAACCERWNLLRPRASNLWSRPGTTLSEAEKSIGLYLQRYVEEGALEEEWPMLFDRIRSVRHADQYSFMALPAEEEVQAGIDLAERFMDRMERLLRETRG
jgi:uncharacterized protein (UPF0332 family)